MRGEQYGPLLSHIGLSAINTADLAASFILLSISINRTTMTTASGEFWNEKITRLFHLYDIDRDGSITPVDFEILADKLSALVGQSDAGRREQYAAARKLLCEELMRADANNDGKVTLEEWLDFHRRLANELRNPGTHPELLQQLSNRINTSFNMLDLNHDGHIARDEWVKTCEFFGVDKDAADKSFTQIATGDKLQEEVAKKLFLDYIKTDDPSHVSNCCLCFL